MRTIPVEMLLATAVALVAARVAGAQELEVAGGATLVAQTTSDDRIRREVVGSADLFLDLHLGPATVHVYVEAGSSPSRGGVSQLLGEANTDAGTALDARRRGRLQISEAKLLLPLGKRATLTGGLLDATGYLDVSRIANDENLFFLGVPFVNNPTIEFPDYALGVVLERPAAPSGGLGLSGLLTSSHGLADNPGVSYPRLLDLRETGKGVFAGAALRWRAPQGRVSLGAWTQTEGHARFDGRRSGTANFGVFGLAGRTWGAHSVSIRGGMANPDVYLAAHYAGLTYLWNRRPTALGVALGHTWASDVAKDGDPSLGDVSHIESFLRVRAVGTAFITASTQYLINSGFDASGKVYRQKLWVPGVRLSWVF